jgi:hypothetical protein
VGAESVLAINRDGRRSSGSSSSRRGRCRCTSRSRGGSSRGGIVGGGIDCREHGEDGEGFKQRGAALEWCPFDCRHVQWR